MTFTLSLPTWKAIKDMFLLIVLYYTTLVEPMFDWYVFGVAYFLGTLTLAREAYRNGFENFVYVLCLFWPIYAPVRFLIWFTGFYVTFGNPRLPSMPKPMPKPEVEWEGVVVAKITGDYTFDREIHIKLANDEIKKASFDKGIWELTKTGTIVFGKIKSESYVILGIRTQTA